MKALTVIQPWASLIATGEKRFETRGWGTRYRGPLAIHAGKSEAWVRLNWPVFQPILAPHGYRRFTDLPYSAVVAIVDLVEVYPVEVVLSRPIDGKAMTNREIVAGDFSHGRFAWHLRVREQLVIPARGKQGLWNWDDPR